MLYNFSEHPSIANQFIAQLRNVNVQSDRMRFRRNMERLGEVMAYEISKKLKYEAVDIETPLGIAPSQRCCDRLVIASILRAGIPLHHGLLNVFDEAYNNHLNFSFTNQANFGRTPITEPGRNISAFLQYKF